MFAPLVAQLKANPKTIVFTEGNDPRILEAASKLLAEGCLLYTSAVRVFDLPKDLWCSAVCSLREIGRKQNRKATRLFIGWLCSGWG